jgi:RecJ-like exonuclease
VELASIELNVEARLCLETVRLSMLRGREAAAVRPGVRVLLLAVDGDAAPDAEDPNFGDEEVEAQMRPKNRDAAVVISSARRASAPLRLAPGPAILAALLDN